MNGKLIYIAILGIIYTTAAYLGTQQSLVEGFTVGVSGMVMICVVGWFARREQ